MKLRLAVLTPPAPGPIAAAMIERLAHDPGLDVVLVVDASAPPRGTAGGSAARRRRRPRALPLRLFELVHPPHDPDLVERVAQRAGVAVQHVATLRSADAWAAMHALRPRLALALEGAAPDGALRAAYSTLAVGTEVTEQDGTPALVVGVHRLGTHGLAGEALAQSVVVPEAGETEASLGIKARLTGAELCQEAVGRIVADRRAGRPAFERRGARAAAAAPAPLEVTLRGLRPRLAGGARVMRAVWPPRPWPETARLALQYAATLPLLRRTRARLVREARAPVSIFFYHLVANRPLNHMCLPLEDFVAQVTFLRRYFAVVSLEHAVERVRSGRNEEVCAALTFDDGYRDNAWAIRYLGYLGVPASFFVSIGHVRDGSGFAHDRDRGYESAAPMTEADVRRLTSEGFLVGSHALYHEDFGRLDEPTAERVLRESRELVRQVSGQTAEHFSFPRGQRGANITPAAFRLATQHYRYVYSAYGGYNLPSAERRHFVRLGTPRDLLELAMTMDGYRGLRECLRGDAWGVRSDGVPPYEESAA